MLHTGRSQVPRGPCAHHPTTESTSCWGRYTWAEALLPKHAGLRQPLQSRDTASGALRASLCPTWGPGGCRAVAGSPPSSAAMHVMHTPTPSSQGWPSPALSDEETKSAASVVPSSSPGPFPNCARPGAWDQDSTSHLHSREARALAPPQAPAFLRRQSLQDPRLFFSVLELVTLQRSQLMLFLGKPLPVIKHCCQDVFSHIYSFATSTSRFRERHSGPCKRGFYMRIWFCRSAPTFSGFEFNEAPQSLK